MSNDYVLMCHDCFEKVDLFEREEVFQFIHWHKYCRKIYCIDEGDLWDFSIRPKNFELKKNEEKEEKIVDLFDPERVKKAVKSRDILHKEITDYLKDTD